MRHNKKFNHLSRKANHRAAMLSNMACSLIMHKRISTTLAKAKALRIYVEPILTRAKEDNMNNRRLAFSLLKQKEVVTELFQNVGEVTSNNHKALLGAYSDLDRIAAGGSKLAQHFSRKPNSSPELLVLGESIVTPVSFASPISEASITKGPMSAITTPSTTGTQTINGRTVYVDVASAFPRYQFRFVNTLGCLKFLYHPVDNSLVEVITA